MDRHRSHRDDHREHHRDQQHRERHRDQQHHHDDSREQNYSLGELKERARREMHRGDHRPSSGSRDHRDHRDQRNPDRRRSRSRSPSNRGHRGGNSRRNTSHSPNRNRNYSNNRGRREDDQGQPRQQFNRHRNPDPSESSFRNASNRRVDNQQAEPKGSAEGEEEPAGPPPEIRPNFELTGNLAKDTNTFNGVLVKYHEPAEAMKPTKRWRFYPFKGDTPLEFIPLHRQSAYLFGRDRRVADVPVDHPSCSKQHAVLQFRSVEATKADGTVGRVTRPYIIDLDSGNGTFVNGQQVQARRYVELLERDVVKFGFSSREYVLLHDESQNDEEEEEEEGDAVDQLA